MATPEKQLASSIGLFGPADQKVIKAVRRALKARFKTCCEVVYNYPNSLVIGYSPTGKGYDSIVSIAARADGVWLYFLNGPRLPDPTKRLLGSAKLVRFIQVESAATLKEPAVEALIRAAIGLSKAKPPKTGRGELIIQKATKK